MSAAAYPRQDNGRTQVNDIVTKLDLASMDQLRIVHVNRSMLRDANIGPIPLVALQNLRPRGHCNALAATVLFTHRLDLGDGVASVAIKPMVSTDRSAPKRLRRLARPELETLIQTSPSVEPVVA